MSKLMGELSYKDWMILKHALETRIKVKQDVIEMIEKEVQEIEKTDYKYSSYKKLKKDLEEEKAALKRLTKLTDNFEKYVKGGSKYYNSRPCDCE